MFSTHVEVSGEAWCERKENRVLSMYVEVVRGGLSTSGSCRRCSSRTWRWSARSVVRCGPQRVLFTHVEVVRHSRSSLWCAQRSPGPASF